MSKTPEIVDDISTLAKICDWFAMIQVYKGTLWARLRVRTEPLQHLSQRLHFAEFKKDPGFCPTVPLDRGTVRSQVNGSFWGLGTFNCAVHIHAFSWRWCLISAQGKIISCLLLMNWFWARVLRIQAKIRCLEHSIYFYLPRVLAVTITTEHGKGFHFNTPPYMQ